MKKIFKIRTKTQAVYIALIFLTGIVSMSLLVRATTASMADVKEKGYADPYDVSTYFIPKSKNESFHYPDVYSRMNGTCINRESRMHDFLRIFGFQPGSNLDNNSYVLVFGGDTTIGKYVIELLEKRKIKYIKWPRADTFGAFSSTKELFVEREILGCILCDNTFYGPSTHAYYRGVCELISSFQKPFEIVLTAPYSSEIIEMAKWFGAYIVFVPPFLDAETADFTNPLVRAKLNCMAFNQTMYVKEMEYSLLRPKDIAKHLVEQLLSLEPQHISLTSGTKGSIEYISNIVARESPGCEVLENPMDLGPLPEIPQPIIIGKTTNTFDKEVRKALKKLPKINLSDPYVTIATYGKNDGTTETKEILQSFFDHAAHGISKIPLAKIEFIVVDLTEKGKTSLSELLSLDEVLKGRVRFIKFPEGAKGITPTRYSAWNIGIRRAKGQFILTCSMNDFLSNAFFYEIASQLLDKRIVYRANVWIAEQHKQINKGFDYNSLSSSKYAGELCRLSGNGFRMLYSGDKITDNEWCGTLDFILCSKEIWEQMEGFPEFTSDDVANADQIIKYRFLRMYPGIFTSTIRATVLRIIDSEEELFNPKNNGEQLSLNVDKICGEYLCDGRSVEVLPFEKENWGIPGTELIEKII